MNNNITTVLFDCDGVLIDGPMFSDVLEKTHGITLATTQEFFTGIFIDCINGKADLKEEITPYLKQWNWEGSIDEFLHLWFETENTVNEHIIEYVKQLRERNIDCHVATCQEKYRTAYLENELHFADIFNSVQTSARIGYSKPDTKFFTKALENIGNPAPETVIFFDNKQKNVDSAGGLGINAYVYKEFSDMQKIIEPLLQ